MMIRVFSALMALSLCACATPHATIYRASEDAGQGGYVMSLPATEISIAETRTKDENEVSSTFTVESVVIDSDRNYFIEPENLHWRETRLAPVYFENTSVIKTLTVETIDRRAALAQGIFSLARTVGIDLSVGDGRSADEVMRAPLCNITLSNAQVSTLLQSGAVQTGPCLIEAAAGRLPPDAMALATFDARYVEGGADRRLASRQGLRQIVPYAACRRIVLMVSNVNVGTAPQRYVLHVPDPGHVRLAALPYHAVLNFENICSVPSVTDEAGPEKTDLEVLNEILQTFRNAEEDD